MNGAHAGILPETTCVWKCQIAESMGSAAGMRWQLLRERQGGPVRICEKEGNPVRDAVIPAEAGIQKPQAADSAKWTKAQGLWNEAHSPLSLYVKSGWKDYCDAGAPRIRRMPSM